jgi:hypothetical protein
MRTALRCLRIRDGELNPDHNREIRFDHTITTRARTEDSSGDSEEQSEEDEEEESEEEEEEDTAAAGGSNQPEVSRAERRELKKKQAAAKQGSDDDEDKDLINTNHVEKKLNIADLGKDRQLSRRER